MSRDEVARASISRQVRRGILLECLLIESSNDRIPPESRVWFLGSDEGVLAQHPVRKVQDKHLREEEVRTWRWDGKRWGWSRKQGRFKGEERVAADEGRLSLGGGKAENNN
jgi:hypothetical protein